MKDEWTLKDYHLHLATIKPGRKSKYGNRKVKVDGMTFDSKKEYRRWIDLNILLKAKKIFNLKRQVKFDLGVCNYYADFTYNNGREKIVEDVKGFKTGMYKLKKKLMKQVHGIEIKET